MTLRAGLLGLGQMGRHHARVLDALDGVDFVAVADPIGDPRRAAAGRPILATIEELIASRLDYCVVAVPTKHHEEAGLALAAAGIHALIEKPLAPDVASATRLAQAFDERGLIGAVGHVERFNPALQQARQRLEAGDLGALYQIATRRQGPFPARIGDVGVVKDLATHDIDLTAWVSRQPYTWVAARTAFRSGREHEDLVAVVGQLADGTVTNHLVNWLSPLKERVTVITGERGAFVVDTLTADLTFYANGTAATQWDPLTQFRGVSEGDVIRYAFAKPEPLVAEHTAFRDAVLGRESRIVTMQAGLATVSLATDVLQSAEHGVPISPLVSRNGQRNSVGETDRECRPGAGG